MRSLENQKSLGETDLEPGEMRGAVKANKQSAGLVYRLRVRVEHVEYSEKQSNHFEELV